MTSNLALQLGLVIHTPGLWLQENSNISTISRVTKVYHVYHHQVHHILRVTHSQCNTAIDTLSESRVWHCCYSPKSSLCWSLRRTKSSITPSRSTGLTECATRMNSWFNRDCSLLCVKAHSVCCLMHWMISHITLVIWQAK